MIHRMARLGWVFLLALGLCAGARALQPSAQVKVKGWSGASTSVPVYTSQGLPKGKHDLSAQPVAGVRQWNPEFSLVKISGDPGDDRWVPAKHLDLVFCERRAQVTVTPDTGRSRNNRALSIGSGGTC